MVRASNKDHVKSIDDVLVYLDQHTAIPERYRHNEMKQMIYRILSVLSPEPISYFEDKDQDTFGLPKVIRVEPNDVLNVGDVEHNGDLFRGEAEINSINQIGVISDDGPSYIEYKILRWMVDYHVDKENKWSKDKGSRLIFLMNNDSKSSSFYIEVYLALFNKVN